MINRYKLLIIIALFLCSVNTGYGQEKKVEEAALNKNLVYANVGFGPVFFTATGYYERIIKQKMWNRNISSFVKAGFGWYAPWGEGGFFTLAQYGILTGAKNHHLEVSAGLNYFFSGDLEDDFFPLSATVGWRYQKPAGKFVFRIGASYPEVFYIGLGRAF